MRSARVPVSLLLVAMFLFAQAAGLHYHAHDADHQHVAVEEHHEHHEHEDAPGFHVATLEHEDSSHFMSAVHDGVDAMFSSGWDSTLLLVAFLVVAIALAFGRAVPRPPPLAASPLPSRRHWRPPLRAPPR